MAARKSPVPLKQFTCNLPAPLFARLKAYSQVHNTSQSAIVADAVADLLARPDTEQNRALIDALYRKLNAEGKKED